MAEMNILVRAERLWRGKMKIETNERRENDSN